MNDRLEPLMHRRVIYTVTDQDGIYTGTGKRMAQVEHTASEIYGFEYADSLHRKYLGEK